MWNLEPPPEFRGFDPEGPLTLHQRHLPHWRQPGATYFVTFRLADSIPKDRIRELAALREQWEAAHPAPQSHELWNELWRTSFKKIDQWLDEGHGSCRLASSTASQVVSNALQYFNGSRYELGCSVVMPNHVHSIVRPFARDDDALSRITHSWKRHTSRVLRASDKADGPLWQSESYDRIIRDAEHLWRTIQYIGRNPAKSGRDPKACQLWLSPEWEALGWKFQ